MAYKSTFFNLFRRRGFAETMEILHQFPEMEAIQSKFFEALIENESYPNTYFRVKGDLLTHKLIAYKLNENNEKVIYLTPKGKEVWDRIKDIEEMI